LQKGEGSECPDFLRSYDFSQKLKLFEAVSKYFPLTAGFKIKEGDPTMVGLTTPLK